VKFESPVFIVGAGRSGSTIFHQMFCDHPQVAWMSTLCDKYPADPAWNRALMRSIDAPVIGPLLKRKFHPSECYTFWNRLYRGFARPYRDLVAADVAESVKNAVPRALAALTTGKRHRLLVKNTGWPRVGFLGEIFPGAKFIHMYRDGRAVANSLMQVDFWWGWRGPWDWRRGPLSPFLQQEWERHDRSFVALAAIEWKIMMEAMEAAKTSVAAGNLCELRYEEFAADPVAAFRRVVSFCGLDWSDSFERALRNYSISTANGKWKKDLTTAQQVILQDVLGDTLARYGYA
jgi:hypothetical protein